jgi:hypothetical protein
VEERNTWKCAVCGEYYNNKMYAEACCSPSSLQEAIARTTVDIRDLRRKLAALESKLSISIQIEAHPKEIHEPRVWRGGKS